MFMRNKHRFMGQAGTKGRRFVMAVALMALASLGIASAALAAPGGEYTVFKYCPTSTSGVKACLVSKTESGEIVIGNKKEAKEKNRCADRQPADAAGRDRQRK
jgi:hypothetical protein